MQFLKKKTRILVFGALAVFFIVQFLFHGISYAPDTPQFEVFGKAVYPMYPLAMWVFRSIFGVELGYNLLGVFQNLLLATGIFSLVDYARRVFRMGNACYVFSTIVLAMVFVVQKWFTKSGIISSNTLFSEAFSLPFYLLFFRFSLEAFLERNKKAFVFSGVFALACILTRGQLYWTVIIVVINSFLTANGNRRKALFSALIACALIVGCVQGARTLQTARVEDEQTKSPVGMFLLTTAIYCSDNDDATLFAEETGERRIFEKARSWMDEPKRLAAFSYESGDLTNRQRKFETYYDRLKLGLIGEYEAVRDEGMSTDLAKMTATLIFANLGAFITHCAQNMLTGLIRTVAILRPFINILACLFLVFMLVCSIVMRKNVRLRKEGELACLGLMCTVLNALIMAPGVFAISRYVVYNMSVLYLAAILLLRRLLLEARRLHHEKQ